MTDQLRLDATSNSKHSIPVGLGVAIAHFRDELPAVAATPTPSIVRS